MSAPDRKETEVSHLRRLLMVEQQKVARLTRELEHVRLGALESHRRLQKAGEVIARGVRAIRRSKLDGLADLLTSMLRGLVPDEELLARPLPDDLPPPPQAVRPVTAILPPEDSL